MFDIEKDIIEKLKETMEVVYSEPTAPFNEYRVLDAIEKYCKKNDINCFRGKEHELWLNVLDKKELETAKFIFSSHTDHPGINFKNGKGKWVGGSPDPDKLVGETIRVFNEKSVAKAKITESDKDGNISISKTSIDPKAGSLWFNSLPSCGYEFTGDKIKMYAADDLILVSSLLAVASTNFDHPILFTREEEFELTGVTRIIKDYKLDKSATIIVTDTSFEMSTIKLGDGVGLRQGDTDNTYSKDITKMLKDKLEESKTKFVTYTSTKGKTEASSFIEHGFKNVGSLSVAVRHQHNKDAHGNPTPEYVKVKDITSLIKFLVHYL